MKQPWVIKPAATLLAIFFVPVFFVVVRRRFSGKKPSKRISSIS